jgi:hypothetical protein
MAKVIKVRAPENTSLAKMSEAEIRKMVTSEAARHLESLPVDIRPVGVNALSLSSNPRADVGVWAEWTRACGDQRHRIDEYVDPPEFEIREAATIREGSERFNSSFVIRQTGSKQGG